MEAIANPNRSQSAEALTENFYKKKFKISSKSAIPVIEINKKLLQALVEQSITKTMTRKRTVLQDIQENKATVASHLVEKKQSKIKKFSQEE